MKAHLRAGRSRFTISSARANNANTVRVLTTVNFYIGKYKQRDYFSWVQYTAVQENMQSSRYVINMGNHLALQNRKKNIFHLSKLLNVVAYLIRKTHKITNKKVQQPILNL